MADITDLLNQYIGAGSPSVDKQVKVADAATQKQAQLNGYRGGAVADVDLTQLPTQEDLAAIANGPILNTIADTAGRGEYIQDATAYRNAAQTAGDSVVDVVNGFLQGALGMGAMGAGVVSDKAGTAISGAAQSTNDYLTGLQSDPLNDRRRAAAERNSVTSEHNAELRDQEVAAGSSEFMAGARQIGRDFLDGVKNSDSVTFQSGTAQGIGSLLLGGVIGKGLKAAGGLAAARMAVGRAGPSQAAFLINRVTNAGSMPAAIGALEGGGAYTQAVNEVMAMDHDQLVQTSPDYAALIEQGWDPKDAKAEVANHAGLVAGAIQAPIGVATGALVSKFEGQPFHVPSLKTAVGNVARETVEEGIQSGAGQVSSNFGVQQFANQDKSLTEGVGQAAGEGALYGMGTAGALQAPGAVLHSAVAAIKAPIALAQKGISAATARGQKLEREQEAKVEAQFDTAMDAAVATAPELKPEIDAAIETIADPAVREETKSHVDRLIDNMYFPLEEAQDPNLPPSIANVLNVGVRDRFTALREVAKLASDPNSSPQEKLEAGVWLAQQLEQNKTLFNGDINAALDEMGDAPARKVIEDMQAAVSSVQEHPAIQRAVNAAKQLHVDLAQIQDPSKPEFQQAVKTALDAVQFLPESADLEVNKTLLAHANNGDIQIDPEQRKALEASTAQLEITQQKLAQAEKLHLANKVSEQIRTEEDGIEYKSAVEHLKGIISAHRTGQTDLAAERLNDLMLFAQHMQNKVTALNEHVKTGQNRKETAVPYRALRAVTRKFMPADPKLGNTVWVNRFAAPSIRNAQAIALDSVAVTTLANKLAQLYPELGVKPVELVTLDPVLNGTAKEVIDRANAEKRSRRADQRERSAPPEDAQPVAASDKAQEKQNSNPAQTDQKAAEPEQRADKQDPAAPEQGQQEAARQQSTESVAVESDTSKASPEEVRTESTTSPEANQFRGEDAKAEQKAQQTDKQTETKAAEPTKSEAGPEADTTGNSAGSKDLTSIGSVYPNLIENLDKGVRNMFKRAYSLPKVAKSRMVGIENPIRVIIDALKSNKAFEERGAKLRNKLRPEVSAAYTKLLTSYGAKAFLAMEKQLATVLDETIKDKNGNKITKREALLNGGVRTPITTWVEHKALNITESDENGNVSYNNELMSLALLAGIQWTLTHANPTRHLTREEVADRLGLASEYEVTDEIMKRMSTGNSLIEATFGIQRMITRFWGINESQTEARGYVDGITEGVAKEVLQGLLDAGLIKADAFAQESEYVDNDGNVRSFDKELYRYSRSQDEAFTRLWSDISRFPDAIEQLTMVEPEADFYIGTPPSGPTKRQLRGRIENTEQQQQVIETERQTKYFANTAMINFLAGLGKDRLVKLSGSPTSGRKLNRNYKQSLDSKNSTLTGAWDHMMKVGARLQNMAEAAGVDTDQLPVFFDFNFSRVGRLHMQGEYNPQANKLIREIFLPTRDTVDLEDGSARSLFMLAVAQHLGVKVHKKKRVDSIQEVVEKKLRKMPQTLKILQDWGVAEAKNKPFELSDGDIEAMRSEFGGPVPIGALHALMEYARFKSAVEAKDTATLKAFTTSLYVEADGVTDGPINALMHLATGAFTADWVNKIAKGGLFIGSSIKTLNDFITGGKEAGYTNAAVDLYEETSIKANREIKSFLQKLKRSAPKEVHEQMVALLALMDEFLGEDFTYSIQEEILAFTRSIAKNPLTVTVYGSGVKGIANKITGELVNELYRRLSEGEGSLSPISRRALNRLMFQVPLRDAETGYIDLVDAEDTPAFDPNTADEDITLHRKHIENLQENVRTFFVSGLTKGINEVMKDVLESRDALRSATQVQSIFRQFLFQKWTEEAIAEKAAKSPEFKKNDLLSKAEEQAIWDRINKTFPPMSTGTQTFAPGNTEKMPLKSEKGSELVFSRALNGKMETPAWVAAPSNAGVAGIPTMIIGPGDGQMVQNFSVTPGRPDNLPVFDGINFGLNGVEEGSQLVNKAVLDAWLQGNPLQTVADAYNASLETMLAAVAEAMPAGMQQALSEALGGRGNDGLSPHHILGRLKLLSSTISKLALENQARKNVLAQVNLSVDHMATAESPFEVSDKIQLSGSPQQVAEQLNALYQRELAKLKGETKSAAKVEAKAETKAEPKEDPKLLKRDAGVAVRPLSEITKVLRTLRFPSNQNALVREALTTAMKAGYQFAVGSKEQIQQLIKEHGHDMIIDDEHGLTDPGGRMIYLIDTSAETVAHELLHAATYVTVHSFYNETGIKLNKVQDRAVRNIALLMKQWLEDSEVDQVAKDVVQGYFDIQDMPSAVNEFMSWVLTNQKLRDEASGMKVKSKAARWTQKLIEAIKSLLWPNSNSNKVGNDLLSNLEFNSLILANQQSDATLTTSIQETMLAHNSSFGQDDRLTKLRDQLGSKITRSINEHADPDRRNDAYNDAHQALMDAAEVAESFVVNGFPMSKQEESTFSMMVAAFMTEARLDPNALVRVQDYYDHVIKSISVEDFMANPDLDDPNDRALAQARMNLLTGRYLLKKDKLGRSTLLPTFLALAAVNDDFRNVLAKLPMLKADKKSGKTIDDRLSNLGTEMMDALARRTAGEGQPANINEALAALTNRIAEDTSDQEAWLDQFASPLGNAIDVANAKIVSAIQSLSDAIIDKAGQLRDRTDNKYAKALLRATQGVAAMVNEERMDEVARGTMEAANRHVLFRDLHELIVEFVGRTKDNAAIYDMIKLVRSTVQQIRQQFREDLPRVIAKKFSRELTKQEWTHLFNALAKTDLAVLKNSMSLNRIMTMLQSESKLRDEVTRLEEHVSSLDPDQWPLVQQKAKELAEYMVTGKVNSTNLLRNATAVANLWNELPVQVRRQRKVTPAYTRALDQLISLYALQGQPQETRDSLVQLAKDEQEGVAFAFSSLISLRVDEASKAASTGRAMANHYKGHILSEQTSGVSLIVANNSEEARLKLLGYKKVSNYVGSMAEPGTRKKSYFFAPLQGRAMYHQGILQNVRNTTYGVDPNTGFSVGVMTAGRITDPETVRWIARRTRHNIGNERLMPIFDDSGDVVAYERSVDPVEEQKLERNTDLAKAIGQWKGRQVEEFEAQNVNHGLIDALKAHWDRGQVTDKASYVNVFDPKEQKKDPVLTDAIRLMTPQTRAYIEQTFEEGEFWVRRDMLNDTLGYRSASAGDAWTGTTRWNPEVAKTARQVAMGVMGENAYKYVLTAEKFWQNFVMDARVTIVVKSMVVPAANMVSNVYQLASRGVPLKNIVKGMSHKAAEVDSYIRGRLRRIDLEAELHAAEGRSDIVGARKLRAEIQTIHDNDRRLSIWPLIENGEFASISDVGISQDELLLSEGRLNAYIEKLTDKLPDAVRNAGRYAIISKDTALFKGLQRAVEYGDFLAKAVLYDDLTQRKGETKEYALGRITEEFVNYDRLPGRTRTYLENMGLLWFWNFKIRATKIAMSTLRNNPLHFVLANAVPFPDIVGSVDTPVSANLFSVMADGNLGYSVGPGMGFNAHFLNPWMNIIE
jgi:hypothetical protein